MLGEIKQESFSFLSGKSLLLAFGGNVLTDENDKGTQVEQVLKAENLAKLLVSLIEKGFNLLIVHGNGPQVGNILIQSEEASTKVPPLPLDVCVAESQGSIGYILERALRNRLLEKKIKKDVCTVITDVIVDKNDPMLKKPTKPIGPFYTVFRAQELMATKKWMMKEDAGRGYRRLVASPYPKSVVQIDLIKSLVKSEAVVIAGGGGGIPVYTDEKGYYKGIEAVIDKDFTAAVIGKEVGVDELIILTNVEIVYLNYGTKKQRALKELKVLEAEKYFSEGHFPPGSMGPKIQASINFVKSTGKRAMITSLEKIGDALESKTGTLIVP
jgi:carbamate kinase